MDAILAEVGAAFEAAMPKGTEPSAANLWSFFIERVRANLHLVLCLSPIGDKFCTRARMFPGLINGCTIDWFLPWPITALTEVAEQYLADFDLGEESHAKPKLITHMAHVHSSVSAATTEYFERFRRYAYVTPKSYFSFLTTYQDLHLKKRTDLSGQAADIDVGLAKLVQAAEDVDKMRIDLKEKEKYLLVAQEKSAALLQDITYSTARAEKKKAEVMAVKDGLEGDLSLIQEQKAMISKDLEAAQPALDEADAALKSITSKDIQMLRALKSPPNLIQRLFDCVLVLMRLPLNQAEATKVKERVVPAHSWSFAVFAMGQSNFMENVNTFNKDAVTDEDVELMYPYMAADDFTFADAKKASGNVAGLCTWSKAMATYTHVAKEVRPKMAALKTAEGKLKVANAKLKRAQEELDVCQADLDAMQASFDDAMQAKHRIQIDAEATQKRMDAANRLISGLAGERNRWTDLGEAFADETRRLTGDVALACAFVSYAGPFNSEFRDTLLRERFAQDQRKRGIPMTDGFNVSSFMVEQSTIGDWVLEGLPSDDLSVQNGIMVTRSARWPLLVDPQQQGTSWLLKRHAADDLRVTTLTDKRFRTALEDSMAFGTPLLIENVEEDVDPMLDPVLDKAVQKSGRGFKLVMADKECEFVESFCLYMCSRMPNPHFPPELSAQANVINFTVTIAGLEQQLLGRVVQRERAELETQRQRLVEEVNANKKLLGQLEQTLLTRLANAEGNLLDDTSLIEVLQTTKTTAAEVEEKLEAAEQTDKRISGAREEYRPVATRGALLYFLIRDMANLSSMYETSLQQVLGLFDQSISTSDKAPLASKRIANIVEFLTYHVTCYVQRGLYERHKQIFVLLLTAKIELMSGELQERAFEVLLKGGGSLDISSDARPDGSLAWLPDGAWLNCVALSRAVHRFHELPDSLQRNESLWRHWYDDDAPERCKVPEYHEQKLSDFERLLLVRCMREDRALLSAQDYISNAIGKRYIDSRPLDLRAVEDEANCRCPIAVLLSQGADPTASIMDLAKRMKKQLRTISLGQGQEPAARKLINTAVTQGSWVLLQNAHLGLKFVGEIESTVIKLEEINPKFQLWMTTEPHPKFPIGLLQNSIRVTNEAPAGLRAGLKASYAWITQDLLDALSPYKSILYALCHLHSCVMERRRFGPLGFNIPYDFNHSDLTACVQFLQNHLSDAEIKKRPVDWECVNYMICDVQYGGRITDEWDRRVFNTYGRAWLVPAIQESGFAFFEGYRIPQGLEVDTYRKAISQLPLVDVPQVFGLHGNADVSFRTRQTGQVLSTILEVQPKQNAGAGGETREDVVLRVIDDLQRKLPLDYKPDHVRDALKRLGPTKPLNICLAQEVERLQSVIEVVRRSLANLKLAIAGTIVMLPELASALDALFMTRVPAPWAKASQLDVESLGLWFSSIVARAEQLTSWLVHGRPHTFCLAGFFNPQGFLTANRQEVCRRHAKDHWALDDVVNHTEVLKQESDDVRRAPDEGVYLRGLSLEGCRWDKAGARLAESEAKVLFSPLPVLHVTGALAGAKAADAPYGYKCPCYKSPRRTDLNFIFAVSLRSDEPPAKWVLRGVALLTSRDV